MTGEHSIHSRRVPWYSWPLIPFAFLAALPVLIFLSPIALISIPYYKLYPDRHLHIYDREGTTRERQLLARWRSLYRELNIFQRLHRIFLKPSRLRKLFNPPACRP
jgi:hypothetical protein